ncbi:MAG: glycoside hydrolase family 97 catalytic domain-containing protein [Thermoguttaceae bacterium]
MKKKLSLVTTLLAFFLCNAIHAETWSLSSPDNKTLVAIECSSGGVLSYSVKHDGIEAVKDSPLGLVRDDADFSTKLVFDKADPVRKIDERYTLKSGKRLECHNRAEELSLYFKNEQSEELKITFRAYDDGIAFRYEFTASDPATKRIVTGEKTGFRIPLDGKAWIHPYDWNSRLKPSYEQYCTTDMPIGTRGPRIQGWAFPMVFHVSGLWMMITQAEFDRTYPSLHINQDSDGGLYTLRFPEQEESIYPDAETRPTSVLPWKTPWRVIVIGKTPAAIIETNIITHLNSPSKIKDESWIKPGRSSWSWWSGGARNLEVQKRYIDLSAEMGWEYILVDAGWPSMGYDNVRALVEYGNEKGVGIWLWYHSGAGKEAEAATSRTPVLSISEQRKAEFKKISELGIKGVKVDFFDTDKQCILPLYFDVLEDAADNRLMVNFHGAMLPSGWQRTWPNLMTTEGIKGAEGFGVQSARDREANHNCVVPFTRNSVGSMDYTPVTFTNKVRQEVISVRKTTGPHELALAIVFESGVQNYADSAEAYTALPEPPKKLLKCIPAVWDETRYIAGTPGDYFVIARRNGDTWFLAGINGQSKSQTFTLPLPDVFKGKTLKMICDGTSQDDFTEKEMRIGNDLRIKLTLAPDGGFAATLE